MTKPETKKRGPRKPIAWAFEKDGDTKFFTERTKKEAEGIAFGAYTLRPATADELIAKMNGG